MTTLLAVDDSNTMRKVLEITFAGEDDLEVVSASGASEALALLNERQPGIALVDVTLSSSDGYTLCQEIKRAAPSTLVLILSSKQHPYDPSRGGACGADDHIDKPFDTQALIDRVRALVDRAPVAAVHPAAVQPAAAVPAPAYAEPVPAPPMQPPPAFAAPAIAAPSTPELEIVESEPPPAPEPVVPVVPAPAITHDAALMSAATVRPGVEATSNGKSGGIAALGGRLSELGLTEEQVSAVLALSREVVEQAVWEVVPALAETLIKEEIARLTRE